MKFGRMAPLFHELAEFIFIFYAWPTKVKGIIHCQEGHFLSPVEGQVFPRPWGLAGLFWRSAATVKTAMVHFPFLTHGM